MKDCAMTGWSSHESFLRTIAPLMRRASRISFGMVYRIRNQHNDKSYIGQTHAKVSYDRYFKHMSTARAGKVNHPLYDAIRKYGESAFVFETLAWCDDQESLDKTEDYFIQYYFAIYPNGYNLRRGPKDGDHVVSRFNRLTASERIREIHTRPDVKIRHQAKMIIINNDPDVHARKRLSRLITDALPETIARRAAAAIAGHVKGKTNHVTAVTAAWADPIKRQNILAGLLPTCEARRGSRAVNDGIKTKFIKIGEPVPEGWNLGRVKKPA